MAVSDEMYKRKRLELEERKVNALLDIRDAMAMLHNLVSLDVDKKSRDGIYNSEAVRDVVKKNKNLLMGMEMRGETHAV